MKILHHFDVYECLSFKLYLLLLVYIYISLTHNNLVINLLTQVDIPEIKTHFYNIGCIFHKNKTTSGAARLFMPIAKELMLFSFFQNCSYENDTT